MGHVCTECPVRQVDVVVGAAVLHDGQLGGGNDQLAGASRIGWGDRHGHEDRRRPALELEEVIGVEAAAGAGRLDPVGVQAGMDLVEGLRPPRPDLVTRHDSADRHRPGRGHRSVLDRDPRVGLLEQVPEGCHRGFRVLELLLEPVEVRGDERVAGGHVGCAEHRLDIVDRHAQVAEPPDHLGRRDLGGVVVPKPGLGTHVDRLEESDPVVVAQCLHAELGHAREVADGQARVHRHSLHPPPRGESTSDTATAFARRLKPRAIA